MNENNFIKPANNLTSISVTQTGDFSLSTGVVSLAFDCIIREHGAYWFAYGRTTAGLVCMEDDGNVLELARQQGVRIIKAVAYD